MTGKYIKRIITTENRTKILRNNILLSAFFKAIGLCISLLIVPATLGYLNEEKYGIWMTISSILMWFSFFDIGLGNGMRNYLAAAISKKDYTLGRSYLTTTLFLLSIISIFILVVSLFLTNIFDLCTIFNTTIISNYEIKIALQTAILFTLINFVIKNIGFVYVALQKYAVYDLINVSGHFFALIVIYIIRFYSNENLFLVVAAFTVIPVLVYLLSAIPLFIKYPQLKPSINSFKFSLCKQIISKGLGFFIIQITSCLVIFGSSNLFITQISGPKAVTVYNIAYKYFNLLAIGYTIIISPMWNAYTDAYTKGDYSWIKKTFKSALLFWFITVLAGIIMLFLSDFFYGYWVNGQVHVPFSISICVFIFISLFNMNNCVTYLLNGLNKIRVQIYSSIFITLCYLLYIVLFGKYLVTEGVIIAISLCYLIMSIIHLYQCYLLINNKAHGVWRM